MPIVSIIVPVYNVEQYLGECLESIVRQTYQDIEIICINDGSTDGSADILERYRLLDSRVQVITTENQGLSMARNTGMKYASGKYVYFVDSDDYLVQGSIEQMVKTAEDLDLEVLVVGMDSFAEESKFADWAILEKQQIQLKGNYPDIYTGISLLGEFIDNGDVQESAVLFMVKKSFLDRHEIFFVPHVIYEDVLYTTKLLVYAKRIAVLNQIVYKRRIRSSSIMTLAWGFESFRSMLISFMGIKQLITETAAYVDDLRVYKRIINALQMVIYYYSQLDEQQQTLINQLPMDMQFAFYTDIYPHLAADHKIKDILAAFDQQTTDIATLETALNQRATDVATLEAALNQRATDVATLEAALNQRATDVATLEAALNQRAKDVAILETALNQRATDVATLEAALNQRAADVATLETALNQRAADVATLETALNQRAADVSTLETALNQRATDVATLEAALNQRAKDVAILETALNQRATDVATLEATLNQRATAVVTLETALNQRTEEAESLNAALTQRTEEVAALKSRLQVIESTWLYKATAKITKV